MPKQETSIATADELLALPDAEMVTEVIELEPGVRVVCAALPMLTYTRMRKECGQGDTWDSERWETLIIKNGVVQPQLTFEQAEQFRKKRVSTVDGIYAAVLRLSGLTPGGQMAEKAVEDAEAAFREG
jgi:hypothetical protein